MLIEATEKIINGFIPERPVDVTPERRVDVTPERSFDVTTNQTKGLEVLQPKTPEVVEEQDNNDNVETKEVQRIFEDIVVPKDTTKDQFNVLETELGKANTKYQDYLQTEEYLADKAKKQDLYTAMAEFGFRMAGSDSPYFLQAAGKAGTDTIPSIKAATKDATARKKDAQEKLALNDIASRQEKISMLGIASQKATGERKLQLDAQIANAQNELRQYMADLNYDAAKLYAGRPGATEEVINLRFDNLKARQEGGEPSLQNLSEPQLRKIAIADQDKDPVAAEKIRIAEETQKIEMRAVFNEEKVKLAEKYDAATTTPEGKEYAIVKQAGPIAAEEFIAKKVLEFNPEIAKILYPELDAAKFGGKRN